LSPVQVSAPGHRRPRSVQPWPMALSRQMFACASRPEGKAKAADQLESGLSDAVFGRWPSHRRSGRPAARPPWAVSAWVSWCWRPSNRRPAETQIPPPRARRCPKRSPDRGCHRFFRRGTSKLSNAAFEAHLRSRRNRGRRGGKVTSYHRFEAGSDERRRLAKGQGSGREFSHFGPEANVLRQARKSCSRTYGKTGNGEKRYYLQQPRGAADTTAGLARAWNPVSFTPWEPISPGHRCAVYYEGCTVAWWARAMTWPALVDALLDRLVPMANSGVDSRRSAP